MNAPGDELVLEVEERDDLRLPSDRQAQHGAGTCAAPGTGRPRTGPASAAASSSSTRSWVRCTYWSIEVGQAAGAGRRADGRRRLLGARLSAAISSSLAREQDQRAACAALSRGRAAGACATSSSRTMTPGDGLRRLDHREQVESDRPAGPRSSIATGRAWRSPELRVLPFEIAHLAVGAPAEVAVARPRASTCRRTARGRARGRSARPFRRRWPRCGRSRSRAPRGSPPRTGARPPRDRPCDPRELGGDQRRPVREVLRAAPGPDLQMPVVFGERRAGARGAVRSGAASWRAACARAA